MKKIPKKVQKLLNKGKKITPDIHHKMKVVKRKREILKAQNDIENEQIMPRGFMGTHPIRGYKPRKKIDYTMIFIRILVISIIFGLSWILLVSLIDLCQI